MESLTDKPAWKTLVAHRDSLAKCHMRDFFEADKNRFTKFSIYFEHILLDFSKNLITSETLSNLFALAEESNIEEFVSDLISGKPVNFTENRAALHTALRSPEPVSSIYTDRNIKEKIKIELARVNLLSSTIRGDNWKTFSENKITDVISIGIGGSHFGSELVVNALKLSPKKRLNIHFIANQACSETQEKLDKLSPKNTVVIIISKTFATTETLANASLAISWLKNAIGERRSYNQLIAITANPNSAIQFGFLPENILSLWDWVGGRFSLWSAAGLPIALALGFDTFEKLLSGAHKIDKHLLTAPLTENIPVILALIGIWNINFLGVSAHSILPYDTRLQLLPSFLQQLEMESNGKSINSFGCFTPYQTSPVIFGQSGTTAQHTFAQLLHQGTRVLSSDFLISAEDPSDQNNNHKNTVANAFAQSETLMRGKTEKEVRSELSDSGISEVNLKKLLPHRVLLGNKPSNTFLYRHLDAHTLGMLIAIYEHKVAVQGKIWQVNSFDQWGVELSKTLAKEIHTTLVSESYKNNLHTPTSELVNAFLSMRKDTN